MAFKQPQYLVSAKSVKMSAVFWFFGALTVSFLSAIPNVVDGPMALWSPASLKFFTLGLCLIAAVVGGALVLLEVGMTAVIQAMAGQNSKTVRFIEFATLGALNLIASEHLVKIAYALISQPN